jgi:hypothetical protein
MSEMIKHVGKVGEKPCIVVFREIPGDEAYCLVVETQSLTPEQHDAVISVVNSREAQTSNALSEVLNRSLFPDGANMLHSLHTSKRLLKKPVDQVNLTPRPNVAIPLSEVNREVRKIDGNYMPPKTDSVHLRSDDITGLSEAAARDGAILETDSGLDGQRIDERNAQSNDAGEPGDQAKMLLAHAELLLSDAEALKSDAKAKQAEAYKLDPSLKPSRASKKASGQTKAS